MAKFTKLATENCVGEFIYEYKCNECGCKTGWLNFGEFTNERTGEPLPDDVWFVECDSCSETMRLRKEPTA